jgi:PAS domain S-box-containing protein
MNAPDTTRNRRILVIDDNSAIHEDFRKILAASEPSDDLESISQSLFGEEAPRDSQQGFDVESAFQGHEGLERVKGALASARPYAMAFVDVRMPPGWDGVETTLKLWEAYPDLQVVICTAYSDYAWDDLISKVGRSDRLLILKKPFDNVEVLQLANALTEKWRLLQCARLKIDGLEQAVAARTQQWRRSEDKLKHLCNFAPFGVIETDPAGDCRYTNPRWNTITGRGAQEQLTKGWTESIHPEDRESALASWRSAAAQAREWVQEVRLLTSDGELRWAQLMFSPMFSNDSGLVGFMGTAENVTHRKFLESELQSGSQNTQARPAFTKQKGIP